MPELSSGRLRSRLLVGVAAVAVGAPIADKAAAQEAKWQPWLEAGGMLGTEHSFGDVDIFVPVWQDQTSLLFGDVRGRFSSEPTQEGNFGLGYRTQIDPEWILGGYGYFDLQNSKYDNMFYQMTLGAEALTVDWDFRLNAYLPLNSGGQAVDGKTKLDISGDTIQMRAGEEKSLFGFDGEVGWRLPIFPADGDIDVRAFLGGYFFDNSDVRTVAGPRGRLEMRLYDIDILGVQSRLTLDGEIQWDEVRGTQALGGLELRIPLGLVTGEPGAKLSPLDRRMVDRVRRDVDIVTQAGAFGNPEDVIVQGLTVQTHTIVFANAGGTGSGSQGHPIDLNAAPALKPGRNAIIVAQGNNGPIGITNPLQLESGEALIGGASSVKLTGARSGQTVTFHAPGSRPTLVGGNGAANLVELASGGQNRVTGLDLTGAFDNGIFGLDVSRVVIDHNSIGGGVNDGIYLLHDGSGTVTSSFVEIALNQLSGNGGDGIDVTNRVTNGAAITQTVDIQGNTALGNSGVGIVVYNKAISPGSLISQAATLQSNTVVGNGGPGIYVGNIASLGGTIAQSLLIDPTTIAGNGGPAGLVLRNRADTSGSIAQDAAISDSVVTGNLGSGILLDNLASSGGTISQTAALDGNSVSGNSQAGIFVGNSVGTGGTIVQLASLQRDTVTANSSNGLYLANFASSGGVITNAVTATSLAATYNGGNGIKVFNHGSGTGALVSQSVTLDHVLLAGNSRAGIFVYNRFSQSAALAQAIVVSAGQVTGNGYGGVTVVGRLYDGVFTQAITVAGNLISGNGSLTSLHGGGILIANTVANGATAGTAGLVQTVDIENNSILGNSGGFGLFVGDFARNAGTSGVVNLASTIDITSNFISGNTIDLGSSAIGGVNLLVLRSGSNLADSGTVNLVGNGLTIAGNTIVNEFSVPSSASAVSYIPDVILVDSAVNGSVSGGSVNLIGNATLVSGNTVQKGIFLVEQSGSNHASSGGAVSLLGNSVTIQANDFQSGSSAGLVVVAQQIANYGANGTAFGSNVITIRSNQVSGAILVENTVSNRASGGVAGLTNALTIGGNGVSGDALGITVLEGAQNSGGAAALSSGLAIYNNSIAQQSVGIFIHADANSAAVVQSGSLSGNSITSSGSLFSGSSGGGVIFDASASDAGTLVQSFVLSGNLITEGSANGIFTTASGTGTTQSLALTNGNQITNNARFGLYLVNGGGASVTFLTDATDLTGNGLGPLHTAGAVVVP
jgi:hypothetical protein